jgi:hypothetical protein
MEATMASAFLEEWYQMAICATEVPSVIEPHITKCSRSTYICTSLSKAFGNLHTNASSTASDDHCAAIEAKLLEDTVLNRRVRGTNALARGGHFE